jgi:hypothetical protein
MAGCWCFALLARSESSAETDPRATALRGLIPVYAMLIGGLAFIGTIELDPPQPTLLLAPAAPLVLWIFAFGPLAKLPGWKAATLQAAAVLVPLAILLAWIALADSGSEWGVIELQRHREAYASRSPARQEPRPPDL